MRKRYRIIKDDYLGFEVQYKLWWWPFWIQYSYGNTSINTWPSLERAKEFLQYKKQDKVIYYE